MTGKGSKVDAEVRAELAEFKSEINSTIIDSITNGFKEIEKHLSELFNKDIDHIKETQGRFAEHHRDHYENHKDIREKFSNLEKLFSSLTTSLQTQDKIEEKTNRKKEINIGIVVVICAVLTVVGGVIGYLIK